MHNNLKLLVWQFDMFWIWYWFDPVAFVMSDCVQVGEPKFVFGANSIQRMELLVLGTLGWRMQALTPCSFIDYFLSKINKVQYPSILSISRSVQLILSTIKGLSLFVVLNFVLGCSWGLMGLMRGNWLQVLTSWNSGLLKLLQQWPFLFQGKFKKWTLIRPCLVSNM